VRCLLCEKLSIFTICKSCQKEFLSPTVLERELENGLKVVSFYRYEDISDLILSKKSYTGFYILNILAKNSFKRFSKEFQFERKIHAIPVDDRVGESGYSHTAVLTKSLKSGTITPIYGTLHSKSDVKYAGRSLQFRRENRREFQFRDKKMRYREAILIDDVVTTGSTLLEASETLKKSGISPIFALTLATTEN
jgi:competence protein ComFC